jgi:hypothetical protein
VQISKQDIYYNNCSASFRSHETGMSARGERGICAKLVNRVAYHPRLDQHCVTWRPWTGHRDKIKPFAVHNVRLLRLMYRSKNALILSACACSIVDYVNS